MKETSKAMKRRLAENRELWTRIFSGFGIDVGSGDDPLDVPSCIHFDLPDGAGDDLREFFGDVNAELYHSGSKIGRLYSPRFDFIHGSQVLEHAKNPVVMLRSWIEMVRPGGFIVATVPDFELYEKGTWPSMFNAGHRSTWSLNQTESPCPQHFKLPDWLMNFHHSTRVTRCGLIAEHYDHALPPSVDQTLDPEKGAECFIEFVLQKL